MTKQAPTAREDGGTQETPETFEAWREAWYAAVKSCGAEYVRVCKERDEAETRLLVAQRERDEAREQCKITAAQAVDAIVAQLDGADRALIERAEAAESRAEAEHAARVAAERDAAIGAAIQRAAGELPDGFNVEISVERGSGSVTILNPDGQLTAMDVDSDNRLAAEIHAAIDAAISRAAGGEETK